MNESNFNSNCLSLNLRPKSKKIIIGAVHLIARYILLLERLLERGEMRRAAPHTVKIGYSRVSARIQTRKKSPHPLHHAKQPPAMRGGRTTQSLSSTSEGAHCGGAGSSFPRWRRRRDGNNHGPAAPRCSLAEQYPRAAAQSCQQIRRQLRLEKLCCCR